MSTPQERLDALQSNYDEAINNEPTDLANAKSPQEVAAIQANVANARVAYFDAVAAMLSNSGDAVEQAYQAALGASADVEKARSDAEAVAKLIGKLGNATAKATDLLNKAKKA